MHTQPASFKRWLPPDPAALQLLRYKWNFQTLSDRTVVAETSQPLSETELNYLPRAQSNHEPMPLEPWLLDMVPITLTYRLHFGPEGRLKESRTFGVQAGTKSPQSPTATPVELDHTVVQIDEWLDTAPEGVFTVTPPNGAAIIAMPSGVSSTDNGNSLRITTSLTETADAVAFPVLGWPPDDALMTFEQGRVSPENVDKTQILGQTDDEVLRQGAAVELVYDTPEGTLTVLQGPTKELRDILRQRPARWRRSELREAPGSNGLAWVMHDERPGRQWAAFERGPSLLFLEHNGPEAELDEILKRLPQLVLIPKAAPQ